MAGESGTAAMLRYASDQAAHPAWSTGHIFFRAFHLKHGRRHINRIYKEFNQ